MEVPDNNLMKLLGEEFPLCGGDAFVGFGGRGLEYSKYWCSFVGKEKIVKLEHNGP